MKRLSRYFKTSLEDYYYFALNRNLAYLWFALLTGLLTFAALKSYEMFSSFVETPTSVMFLYAWVTAMNFGSCLYMMDEWLSRAWKEWGDFENRTVLKVWIIWSSAFFLAYAIQHLMINQLFEIYDLKMRWLYPVYPKEKPYQLMSFIYIFPVWLVSVFILVQIAISKQSALKDGKSNQKSLFSQREYIFKQDLEWSNTTLIQKTTNPDKGRAGFELYIPGNNHLGQIDPNNITHINVEDHYCRIFLKKQENFEEFFIKMTLKDILNQLPKEHFLQIHRSHIINLAYVSSLIKDSRSYQLALNQGTHTLPISRYRLPQVLSRLEKMISG